MTLTDDAANSGPGGADAARERLLSAPRQILDGLPDAVVASARDGQIVFVNAVAEELFGYRREELLGRHVEMLWPMRERARYTRNIELYFDTEHPLRFSAEAWGLRRDGSEFAGEMSWGIVRTAAGPLLLAVGRDISERRTAEARVRALARMGERALAGADAAVLAAEAAQLVLAVLPVSGADVRLADGSVVARVGRMVTPSLTVPIGAGDELRLATESDLREEEQRLTRSIADILATALTRQRNEERMRHDALHDPLTGLANRTLLRDRLEHALARTQREGGRTGVLFIDLDSFKQVNDAHGHAAGDAVLVELAGRLRRAVRPSDTVARLGGDEFVVVCEQVDETAALALGRRLRAQLAVAVNVGGRDHALSASFGIALGDVDPDAILSRADAALYRAKQAGGGRVELGSS